MGTVEQAETVEAASVLAWRKKQLRAMHDARGERFTSRQVKVLSENGCDLHEVAAMLAVGCTIPLAFDISS